MKRILFLISLIYAFMTSTSGQEIRRLGNTWDFPKENSSNHEIISSSSNVTSVRQDTIIVEEIIRRTDVIHRTEEVIKRVESSPKDYDGQILVPVSIMDSIDFDLNEESEDRETPELKEMEYNEDYISSYPAYSPPGGNYIWVPDSLENDVMGILRGETFISHKNNGTGEEVDKSEMVSFRGKSLPMVLKSRNLGRFDRGLFNFLFIPKGIWQLGLTASYGEFSTENLQLLDLVSDIDFKGKIFSVKPYFAYFLKSNISLGLRLGYTRGEANIGAFNVDIDEDMSFNLHDIMYKSASYSAAITFTQYLGITRRGRFAVFNEVELAMAGGDSDFNRPFNGEMRKTHTTTYEVGLNFSPGVSVYIIDPLSFQVSLGVFGLNLKHEKQKVNDEDLGWRTTSGANFRFNIFNINFGIAVNI